jgi:hypothetical protein
MDHRTPGGADISAKSTFNTGKKIILLGCFLVLAEFTKFTQEIRHQVNGTDIDAITAIDAWTIFVLYHLSFGLHPEPAGIL